MKYLMTFSYNGTYYDGYQIQNDKNTIQGVIEKNLTKINSNNKVKISASGRTDKGVHAINQKAHFILDKNIDENKLKNALNKLLPDDIYIKNIIKVNDDFHARFNVIKKEYIYKINIGEYNVFDRNYIYQYNKKLDVKKMKKASKILIGTHNFKSFVKTDIKEKDYVRTIYNIKFELKNNILEITFIGNGFLRYMVRNLVGTLIEVGSDKKEIGQVKEILLSENREKAGITAPPEGLYLKNVKY